jgi:hypothetical protein
MDGFLFKQPIILMRMALTCLLWLVAGALLGLAVAAEALEAFYNFLVSLFILVQPTL